MNRKKLAPAREAAAGAAAAVAAVVIVAADVATDVATIEEGNKRVLIVPDWVFYEFGVFQIIPYNIKT